MLAATSVVSTYSIGIHRFAFVIPLLLVAVGEVVAVSQAHHTITELITMLLIANAVALVVTIAVSLLPQRRPRVRA